MAILRPARRRRAETRVARPASRLARAAEMGPPPLVAKTTMEIRGEIKCLTTIRRSGPRTSSQKSRTHKQAARPECGKRPQLWKGEELGPLELRNGGESNRRSARGGCIHSHEWSACEQCRGDVSARALYLVNVQRLARRVSRCSCRMTSPTDDELRVAISAAIEQRKTLRQLPHLSPNDCETLNKLIITASSNGARIQTSLSSRLRRCRGQQAIDDLMQLCGDVERCDQGTQVVGQLAIVFARTQIKVAIASIRSFGDQFAFSREAFKTFQFGLKADHVASPKTRY